jgi:hypothetical protein
MRESRPYGSVRGARGNSRPYRVVETCVLWRILLHLLTHRVHSAEECMSVIGES